MSQKTFFPLLVIWLASSGLDLYLFLKNNSLPMFLKILDAQRRTWYGWHCNFRPILLYSPLLLPSLPLHLNLPLEKIYIFIVISLRVSKNNWTCGHLIWRLTDLSTTTVGNGSMQWNLPLIGSSLSFNPLNLLELTL